MALKKLFKEDIIIDDRTQTTLELKDYDWMSYKILANINSNNHGEMIISFEYFGSKDCVMKVVLVKDGEEKDYSYTTTYNYEFFFNLEVFIKYIKLYMNEHIAQWNNTNTFEGIDLIIEFYNEVLEKSTQKVQEL